MHKENNQSNKIYRRGYRSEIDQFLQDIDKKRIQPTSCADEKKKSQLVSELRDKNQCKN